MPRPVVYSLLLLVGLAVLVGTAVVGLQEEPVGPTSASAPAMPAASPASQPPVVDEPLDLVPAESLLCWYGRPFPDTTPLTSDTTTLATWLQMLSKLTLDAPAKLYGRMFEMLGLTIRCPHALALIDAQAKPVESDPSGQRVDRLRFAAIVETDEHEAALARVIQATVNEQTDNRLATLARHQAGRWVYQELHDSRLPDWCTIAWGKIDRYFVLTVGPDVWPLIAAVADGQAAALSHADWLASVRGERGHKALIEIILSADAIRQRLDPFVEGRASEFFEVWRAGNLQRAHWALGYEGSAMYCVGHFMEEGRVRERVFADPGVRDPRLLATIPETARYAIYQVSAPDVIPGLCRGWLVTQGVKYRQRIEEAWNEMQAEYGFDAQRDILAHLTGRIVMHNDPPHPLHVPLAITTLSEIRDEPQRVRQAMEEMCVAWQAKWKQLAERSGQPAIWSVERDPDGVWYLQYGGVVDGPAWTVTDRFIITSWSPAALRSYLEKVSDRAGRREN